MHTALLLHVGCVGYAHETARLFGDEHVLNMAAERTNLADSRDVAATLVPMLLRGQQPRERVRLAFTSLTRGKRFGRAYDTASCEVGRDAARRLRLPEGVQTSVYHSERILAGSQRLTPLARLVGMHHERCDRGGARPGVP